MFRKLAAAALLLALSTPALAVTCAQGDPNHPAVPHVVSRYRDNPNTSPINCCQDPNVGHLRVCDPAMPPGVPTYYVKCIGGDGTPGSPYTGVAEMSQAEKDLMDAYLAPDPEPVLQVQAPTGEIGGIQARPDEVRVGSRTDTTFYLAYNNVNHVALGQGGRVSFGLPVASIQPSDKVAIDGPVRITDGGTRPTCAVELRGMMWVEFNTGGTADQLYLCRREGGNSYVWVQVTP